MCTRATALGTQWRASSQQQALNSVAAGLDGGSSATPHRVRQALTGAALVLPMFLRSVESKVSRSDSAFWSSERRRASLHPCSRAISSATHGSASLVASVSRNTRRVRRAMKSSIVSQYCGRRGWRVPLRCYDAASRSCFWRCCCKSRQKRHNPKVKRTV